MNKKLVKYIIKFDNAAIRDRILVFAGIFVLLSVIWFTFFWKPLQQSKTTTNKQVTVANNELKALKAKMEIETIKLQKAKKTNLTNAAKIAKFESNPQQKLISPQEMTAVLKKLLTAQPKLNLLGFKNLPSAPIKNAKEESTLYEYGIIMKLSGDYFAVMDYLQTLENLKWRIFWDKLNYQVTKYPQAEVTLQFHTISDKKGWIHV